VSDNNQIDTIPVVDVDQAFPAMVDHTAMTNGASGPDDVGPQVNSALRDLLGWRPRVEDPKAFVDALTASFRLVTVQGHIEAQFVPRGYAVQADLGAVSGGQASLYRRALIVRSEIVRILDGLVSLRPDSDPQDMEAYRTLVRGAIERLVDELGMAGGPRVEVVDNYFQSLTGSAEPGPGTTADTVAGQLGALRDRFGLIDANVNTVEEEGIRTSFWTLVDMVVDLQTSWHRQRKNFTGGAGQGFIGTELILLSRFMEAAADQVDELETVFDSLLLNKTERRTVYLDTETLLTLDGLLMWLRSFLGEEGRRIAEDTGRDGIVSTLAPTLIEIFRTFKKLADKVGTEHNVITYLPASCCADLPAALHAARSRIAIASTCRLLKELLKTAQRIGRYPAVVLTNVLIREVYGRTGIYEVEFRGFNIRPTFLPAFIKQPLPKLQNGATREIGIEDTVRSLHDSATADDEGLVGFFDINDFPQPATGTEDAPQSLRSVVTNLLRGRGGWISVPAEDLAIAVIDGELGRVIYAPEPVTWPVLLPANTPVAEPDENRWKDIPGDDTFSNVPSVKQVVYEPPPPYSDPDDGDDGGDPDTDPDGDYPDDGGDGHRAARTREVRGHARARKAARKAPAKKAAAKKAAAKHV
jgi:hypothetical protein